MPQIAGRVQQPFDQHVLPDETQGMGTEEILNGKRIAYKGSAQLLIAVFQGEPQSKIRIREGKRTKQPPPEGKIPVIDGGLG